MVEPVYGDVFDHHSVVYEFENGVRVYALLPHDHRLLRRMFQHRVGRQGQGVSAGLPIWGETDWRWRGQGDPYQIEHDLLFAGIRAGKPVNNGDYMARSTMITVMGQISCYTGKEVTWEQIMASDFAYPPRPEDCQDGMEPPTQPGPDGSYPVYVPGRTRLI